jgi:phosphoribosyl 1,2-cyclic phosphodiesterase
MEITVLASSSKANCIYVQDPAGNLLLDCGLPWKKTRQRLNFHTSGLAGVLLTHRHNDHSRGAKEIAAAGIDIYGLQETFDAIELSGHRVHAVKPLEQFNVGSWTCLGFEIIHDVPGLGFLLVNRTERVLYLTDSAYCKPKFERLTRILIECNHSRDILDANIEAGIVPVEMRRRLIRTHMGLDVVKEFFRVNDLSRVEQIYLLHLSDNNSDAEMFKRQIQEISGKSVYVE